MSKKPDTTPAAATDAPKKRSKVKLALFAMAPLVLAGAGYGGWMFYSGGHAEAAVDEHAAEPVPVSAVPTEIAAETSFTHSFALATIIASQCGKARVPALQVASDAEAHADGMLVNLSWQAAARRTLTLDEGNCRRFLNEVRGAERKAMELAEAKAGGGGHGGKGGGDHGAKPAAKPAHH
ncbi:hypothetical protein [Mesorhizobium sp. CAU 1741]|uniref:hypothetical protein n=1 Tax=Mesorhizobium sp. CAU 1741 TaxID=3140366 RepID=UPI00325B03A3